MKLCKIGKSTTNSQRTKCSQGLSVSICVCLLGLFAIRGVGEKHAQADAIVVTRAMSASTVAEIFIDRDTVRVGFEVGLSDISAFRNVLPDKLYERLGNAPEPLEERLSRFFVEDWILRADDGAALLGRVTALSPRQRIRRGEVTGNPLPVQDDAEPVVFLQIQYELVNMPNSHELTESRRQGCEPHRPLSRLIGYENIGREAQHHCCSSQ